MSVKYKQTNKQTAMYWRILLNKNIIEVQVKGLDEHKFL